MTEYYKARIKLLTEALFFVVIFATVISIQDSLDRIQGTMQPGFLKFEMFSLGYFVQGILLLLIFLLSRSLFARLIDPERIDPQSRP